MGCDGSAPECIRIHGSLSSRKMSRIVGIGIKHDDDDDEAEDGDGDEGCALW